MKTRLTDGELELSHDGMCAVRLDGEGAQCTCLVHWVKALQDEADKLKVELCAALARLDAGKA
jgi:hypothetical protein